MVALSEIILLLNYRYSTSPEYFIVVKVTLNFGYWSELTIWI